MSYKQFSFDYAMSLIKNASKYIVDPSSFSYSSCVPFCQGISSDYVLAKRGATKLVLIFDEYPEWVFKIPYRGSCYGRGSEFHPFIGAFNKVNKWDYIAVEQNLYNEAKRYGVERYFAKNILLGKVRGLPIYAQRACVSIESAMDCTPLSQGWFNRKSKRWWKEEDEAESEESCIYEDLRKNLFYTHTHGGRFSGNELDIVWLKEVGRHWSNVESLTTFLQDFEIEDLHTQNYGYTAKEGIPIIFDYGGFNDKLDDELDSDCPTVDNCWGWKTL